MKNRKLMNTLLIILPVAAAVLTALPGCVKMCFAVVDPEPSYVIEYCSGFSMLPVGYGNFGPMLAGISAIVLSLFGILYAVKEKAALVNWMFFIAVFGAAMSQMPLIFDSMSIIGFGVEILLIAESALLYYLRKHR